jgi:hypothetical protein
MVKAYRNFDEDGRRRICNCVRVMSTMAADDISISRLANATKLLLNIRIANDTVKRILSGENP